MNILILSASTGGGHMRASRAIENYMSEHDKSANVKIVDSLLYINPILNKTVTSGYVYLATKTPKIYGKIYELTNKEDRWISFVNRLNYLFANKLLPLIDEFKPDVIITTHPFPTEMVSILKAKELVNIPLVCIMTDYAPHKTWVNQKVDAYIVSNDDMVKEMSKIGVREEVIYPYGIPIEQVFFEKKDKDLVLNELELNPNLPTILMMAGSFGVTNVFKIYEDIINIDREFQVIVITGKNQKLYDEFAKVINKSEKHTKLIYFTDEVNKFMQAADIIITKPGGLTITEALASNIPMAIFDAIPGQEEENAEFLINHNMAIKLEKNQSCDKLIEELLMNKEKLNNMKEACRSFDKNDSSKNICALINELVENSKM
ncbi:glycosyltransferase [Clostridium sp. NSJ-49]|uniref:UDP-glucuronosyltransferase n=1 Tax=Clostridium disporicum TaxID=84024 RepID=A0A174DH81_9CLOT|nr:MULTISPECIES: glycosyltransferase [Clostridium]MBC5624858.1 glycosyltransferase [Clostridium sp. NSJ-49]MCD2500585.1 glycosyltransferase [Clostridium sp. NSJ-145]MDU6340058.1 glycosyltransferase [Clostridium sp.]CUO23270.1 UDP-glucuronosyltransferase [Clostridium disporicum]